MMDFISKPEVKIAESTLKALNRLDRTRESMGLSFVELNKLLVTVLGSNAPNDYRQLNSAQAMHVIRYIARNGAKILLERSQKARTAGEK
jgi:hypothetical protein